MSSSIGPDPALALADVEQSSSSQKSPPLAPKPQPPSHSDSISSPSEQPPRVESTPASSSRPSSSQPPTQPHSQFPKLSQSQNYRDTPPSSSRPGTSSRRRPPGSASAPASRRRQKPPPTARPDTDVSSIGEIPEQTFFPDPDPRYNDDDDGDGGDYNASGSGNGGGGGGEGGHWGYVGYEGIDEEDGEDEGEDEEGYSDDDDDDEGVFAFHRPVTAAIGVGNRPGDDEHNDLDAAFDGNRETVPSAIPPFDTRTQHSGDHVQADPTRTVDTSTSTTSPFSYVASSKGFGVARGIAAPPPISPGGQKIDDPLTSSVMVLDYSNGTGAGVASGLGTGGGEGAATSGSNGPNVIALRRTSNPNATAYVPSSSVIDPSSLIHTTHAHSPLFTQSQHAQSQTETRRPKHSEEHRKSLDTGKHPLTHHVHYHDSLSSSNSQAWPVEDGSSLPGSSEDIYRQRTKSQIPLVESTESDFMSEGTERPITRGTWKLSEVDGATTVPDGMTTRGDGAGGVLSKWDEENASFNLEDMEEEEDSPYPEVRASVSNIDDPDMPALTLRVWIIGMAFTILGCGFNTFFVFRSPSTQLFPSMVPLVAYPFGKGLAWILPLWSIQLPRFLGGKNLQLNPGPFNIKEHTTIVVMANVAFNNITGLHPSVAAQVFLGRYFPAGFQIMILLATQILGFGMAGIGRRFLVWPASMIWPYNLVTATNLNMFHAEDDGQSGMSRYKFFMIFTAGSFAYYFLPGYLLTALSYFSWVCWIFPKSPVVNQLFGVNTGLGMGILTFDWNQIFWIGSPLTTPWWAEVNIGIGFLICYWIAVPIMYYTNVWNSAYLPISMPAIFDRFGNPYNVSSILTPAVKLDDAAYAAYSPVFISITFAMTLTLALALSTALLVHTALNHGPSMYRAIRYTYSEPDDIHMKLMKQYPEVPAWWFLIVLIVPLVLSIIAIEIYKSGIPVYALLIAIALPALYYIPSGFVYAMTGQMISINLPAEAIPGMLLPGETFSNMVLKTLGVSALVQSLQFAQDMKLGHYMKVPPRDLFIAQVSAISIATFTAYGVKELLFHAVPDICQPKQASRLTCPNTKVLFNSGVLWGAIGPQRMFGSGATYHNAIYALAVGALLPIPFWFYNRRRPNSILKWLNLPLMLNAGLNIPPATGINYASWLVVGFVFQYLIRNRAFSWWSKYNYTLSAALGTGTQLSVVFIFLILGLPNVSLDWGGNTIWQNTLDAEGVPFKTPPETGFGPDTWT